MNLHYTKRQKRLLKAVLLVISFAVVVLLDNLFHVSGVEWCESFFLLITQLLFAFACYTRFYDLLLLEKSIHLVNKYYIVSMVDNYYNS